MTTERKHRCGGILRPEEVWVRLEGDRFIFAFLVPGLTCEKCREELVDRDTAVAIQRSRTPDAIYVLLDQGPWSTALPDFPIMPSASTRAELIAA